MGNNGTAMTTFDRVECIWNLYLPPVDKDDFTKDSFESLSPQFASWSPRTRYSHPRPRPSTSAFGSR